MSVIYELIDEDLRSDHSYDERPDPSEYKMHMHDEYEVLCFQSGKGVFHIEGREYRPEGGDVFIFRPGESHFIEISPDAPYDRIICHFNMNLFSAIDPFGRLAQPFCNRDAGYLNRFRSQDFRNASYRNYIDGMTAESEDRRLQVLSNLLPLLNEIYIAYCHRDEDKNDDSRAVAIINFINLHIKDDISLEEIAQGFYISKPSLCRIFKKATGTTVWDYIITKRLINARHLISSGVSATNACYASGFNDYSVFYRAYRKKYGCSPINGGQSLAD